MAQSKPLNEQIKENPAACSKCDHLLEMYERTPKEDRDYYVMTELFVLLHGSDVCKGDLTISIKQ